MAQALARAAVPSAADLGLDPQAAHEQAANAWSQTEAGSLAEVWWTTIWAGWGVELVPDLPLSQTCRASRLRLMLRCLEQLVEPDARGWLWAALQEQQVKTKATPLQRGEHQSSMCWRVRGELARLEVVAADKVQVRWGGHVLPVTLQETGVEINLRFREWNEGEAAPDELAETLDVGQHLVRWACSRGRVKMGVVRPRWCPVLELADQARSMTISML